MKVDSIDVDVALCQRQRIGALEAKARTGAELRAEPQRAQSPEPWSEVQMLASQFPAREEEEAARFSELLSAVRCKTTWRTPLLLSLLPRPSPWRLSIQGRREEAQEH